MGIDSNLSIRLATPEDASAIANVLLQSFLEYKAAYTIEGFSATTPNTEEVRTRMTEGPTWVAVCEGVIVGTVSAVPRDNGLYVRSMAVIPSARGQNIGALLLDQIENFAAIHGCERIMLSTTPFLSRAIKLYEQAGFRQNGIADLHGTPLLTMEKALKH